MDSKTYGKYEARFLDYLNLKVNAGSKLSKDNLFLLWAMFEELTTDAAYTVKMRLTEKGIL